MHDVMAGVRTRSTYTGHHNYLPLAKTLRMMDLRLEAINSKPLPPWRDQTFTETEIEPDREQAKEKAAARRNMPGISIFSDASGQQGYLGAAAVALNEDLEVSESRQISIGSMEYWSVYAAELMAIYYAISLVYRLARKRRSHPEKSGTTRNHSERQHVSATGNSKYVQQIRSANHPSYAEGSL